MSFSLCPLDPWLAKLSGQSAGLDIGALHHWQMERLRRTVRRAAEKSPHYRESFAQLPPDLHQAVLRGEFPRNFEDMALLPFSSAEDIECDWRRFLCVSLDAVARMVTLRTSGTVTGKEGKRFAFTEDDLGRTADFFAVGMAVLLRPGERVLILLPGADRPFGVADLLIRSLPFLGEGINLDPGLPLEQRLELPPHRLSFGALGFAGNPLAEEKGFLEELERIRPQSVVAAPSQLARLLCSSAVAEAVRDVGLRTLLASSEALSPDLRQKLEETWACEVFDHYGLTESAYGCAVECRSHDGMHIREADIFLECVDVVSGRPVPPGQKGEIVLTTLTREAMPLVRYRTGDYAAILPGPCRCGSPLRRLERVLGRIVRGPDGIHVVNPQKGGNRA